MVVSISGETFLAHVRKNILTELSDRARLSRDEDYHGRHLVMTVKMNCP